jgi:hypothetical protein
VGLTSGVTALIECNWQRKSARLSAGATSDYSSGILGRKMTMAYADGSARKGRLFGAGVRKRNIS